MTKELLVKITKIWHKPNRRWNNKTFTIEEKEYMVSSSKFIWDYFNDDKHCACGNEKLFISIISGYNDKCKKCNQKVRVKKTQNTMLERYGYKSVFQDKDIQTRAASLSGTKEIRQKAQQSMILNGTHQSDLVQIAKAKKTKLEKYGSETYNNQSKAKKTKLEKYGSETYNNQSKAKTTMIGLYGVSSYAKTTEFKDKFSGNNNSSRLHFTNIEDFRETYILENFIKKDNFDLYSASEYFNCTYNAFKKMSFYNTYVSRIGRQVSDNMKSFFDSVFVYDTRKIITPYELDMYSEEYNFAVEYNGLYWHSDKFKDKNYHLMKTELCEEKGIQLFHIFENEWLDKRKKDIWISMINGKQGLHTRLGARKCTIKEVGSKEAKEFLEENHMQGSVNGSVRIALIYNNEIVSLMTFSKARMSKKCQYELLRFCAKKNLSVQGAGSRLLKYFEDVYNPDSLVSYANRRWSEGDFYDKIGFTFRHNSPPNMFWFKAGSMKLESRQKFQKHKLKDIDGFVFDEVKTAKENMFLNDYRVIYDSGNKIYTKEYKLINKEKGNKND